MPRCVFHIITQHDVVTSEMKIYLIKIYLIE